MRKKLRTIIEELGQRTYLRKELAPIWRDCLTG